MSHRIALFCVCVLIFNSAGISAEDAPGYTDTPVLPGMKWKVHDQARPQPPRVIPGEGDLNREPPSDAIVLFDGKNFDKWNVPAERNIEEAIKDGAFSVLKTGNIETKEKFGDCQLHIEWSSPVAPDDRMRWGNSGVFLLGSIEVQVIESHDSFIYADGNAGSIYGQYPALVNPTRKPGQWQSFDIVFTAPEIKDGKQLKPAYITVFFNGVLVQDHVEVLGKTMHRELPPPLDAERGTISLQEHGSDVRYRNIWIRPLEKGQ